MAWLTHVAAGFLALLLSGGVAHAVSIGLTVEGEPSSASASSRMVTYNLASDSDDHLSVFSVVDTGAEESSPKTFEGYSLALSFTPGIATSVDRTALSVSGLTPDLFGTPQVDLSSGKISNLNQGAITGNAGTGAFRVERIDFSIPRSAIGSTLDLSAQLDPGNSIGVDGSTCPGDGCSSLSLHELSVNVVPEPGTSLLVASGLLALAGRRARP